MNQSYKPDASLKLPLAIFSYLQVFLHHKTKANLHKIVGKKIPHGNGSNLQHLASICSALLSNVYLGSSWYFLQYNIIKRNEFKVFQRWQISFNCGKKISKASNYTCNHKRHIEEWMHSTASHSSVYHSHRWMDEKVLHHFCPGKA